MGRRRPFSPLSSTLLCPFMRCTRTRQSTTPPPLSPLSPWTSSRSKEDTSLAVMSTDAFAGEPRSVGGTLGGAGAHGTTSLTEKDGHHKTQDTHGTHSTHGTGAGVGGTGLG